MKIELPEEIIKRQMDNGEISLEEGIKQLQELIKKLSEVKK